MRKDEGQRATDLGVLHAIWWLHRMHGEDTYATELLLEWCGAPGVARMRALARQADYRFGRGFWTTASRKARAA